MKVKKVQNLLLEAKKNILLLSVIGSKINLVGYKKEIGEIKSDLEEL